MSGTTKRNIHISINGKEVVNSLSGIGKAIKQTSRDISNLNKNDADYQEQLKKHQATLALLRAEYGRTKDEIRGVPSIFQRVQSSLGGVASGMLKAFSVSALVGGFISKVGEARQIIIEFDQAQADLAGILQTNKVGIAKLTADSLYYGATTSFTATQVSTLQLELAKLGKTQDEIRGMTKGVIDASIAMDAELGPAAELVGGQMNSFNAAASDAGKFADILSNSTNISATSFEYLSTALPKTSKVASLANVSFEKLNATMGVLSDQNIAAETSGTSFRNILLTASEQGRNYEDMLKEVAQSTDKTAKATELFGKQNATVAVILATSTEKVISQTEALENSAGSAATLAETKMDSIKGSATLFTSAYEGFILSIENGDGVISKATRGIIDFGSSFLGLITPLQKVSEELINEQLELGGLIGQITSSNIAQEERERLLSKLKDQYPDFISMIDDETFSNESLKKALFDINEEYRERIYLQLKVEKIEKEIETRNIVAKDQMNIRLNLEKKLSKIIQERGFNMTVDYGNIEESATKVIGLLKESGARTGMFSDVKSVESYLSYMSAYNITLGFVDDKIKEMNDDLEKTKTETGQITELEKRKNKLQEDHYNLMIKKAKEFGGIEGKDFSAESLKSIEEFVKKRELALENAKGSGNSKKTEKELEREQRLADRKLAIFEKGEEEIDKIIQQSLQNRESRYLTGLSKEIKAVQNKYALDLEKFKDHTERLKELELARDEEIAELKREKANEYALQIFDIEKAIEEEKKLFELEQLAEKASSEEERQLLLIEKARYVADLELEIEMEKELAKVEAVENAEDLKQAIRDKYAQQKAQNDTNFNTAEKALKTQQVDWTRLTEKQKLDITIGALNAAADAFNEGSGAWKAIKIAETIMTTYQSATNAFNSLAGIPIVGPALGGAAAGLAIYTGLRNVQKIASTDMQKMPSFYYGGYTGSATGSLGGDKFGAYTGMTHANEWVMPAFMTQSPHYAPILQWLENERQMGVSGGSAVSQTQTPSLDNSALLQLSMMIGQLSAVLENGVEAKMSVGYEEMMKMNKLNQEITDSSNFGKI